MNEKTSEKLLRRCFTRKNENFEENCHGIWNTSFHRSRKSQRKKARNRGLRKQSGTFQVSRTIARKLFDISNLKKTSLSRMATRRLAGNSRSNWDPKVTPKPLFNSWLLRFLRQ